jgi:lipoprotein NlpI
MPTKFKPSQSTLQRGTKTVVTTHYYIKNISKEELLEEINKDNPNKKRRAKAIKELDRRGVKLVWTTKDKESIV